MRLYPDLTTFDQLDAAGRMPCFKRNRVATNPDVREKLLTIPLSGLAAYVRTLDSQISAIALSASATAHAQAHAAASTKAHAQANAEDESEDEPEAEDEDIPASPRRKSSTRQPLNEKPEVLTKTGAKQRAERLARRS